MLKKVIVLLCVSLTLTAAEITKEIRIEGRASYYSGKFHGRKTASGEIYDKNKLTCASNQFALGTNLKVQRVKGKDTLSVKVKVNDRMHPKYGSLRLVDLSEEAMKVLKGKENGVINVQISVI